MLVTLFICPICQSPLQPATDNWRCDGSLHPKQTLRDLICEQMGQLLGKNKTDTDNERAKINWLDIGCGEGYYTQAMAQQGIIDNLIAADISKPALVELAKASKIKDRLWYQQGANQENANKKTSIYPLVTSAAHLPLSAGSMHGISSIFSPILPEIFADMLTEEGYLIIAKPDIGHLLDSAATAPFSTEAKFVVYILQKRTASTLDADVQTERTSPMVATILFHIR